MSPRQCQSVSGTVRCKNPATHEFLRVATRGARWRCACSQCIEIIRRYSSPLDKLKVRAIEIDAEDEAVRRRKIKQL